MYGADFINRRFTVCACCFADRYDRGRHCRLFGGIVDAALMRFTDAMLSIPVLPLMIVFAALDLREIVKGQGIWVGLAVLMGFAFLLVTLGTWMADRTAPASTFILSGLIAALAGGVPMAGLLLFLGTDVGGGGTTASVVQLIIIVVLFSWMTVVDRRAAALQIRELVAAAKAFGAKPQEIARHIVPNAMAPIIVAQPFRWVQSFFTNPYFLWVSA